MRALEAAWIATDLFVLTWVLLRLRAFLKTLRRRDLSEPALAAGLPRLFWCSSCFSLRC